MLSFADFINLVEEVLDEGIHDPARRKAIFLAGGPGSGKSYVSKKTTHGLGFKHADFFPSSILFKTSNFLGSCLHPFGHMFNVSHSLVKAQSVRIRCSCLESSWGENDAIFFKDPSTWRCKRSKSLWCCANANGSARRRGWRR